MADVSTKRVAAATHARIWVRQMDVGIEKILLDLERLLEGWNYRVSLRIFRTPFSVYSVCSVDNPRKDDVAFRKPAQVFSRRVVRPSRIALVLIYRPFLPSGGLS